VLGAITLFTYVGVEVIAGDTIGLYGQSLGVTHFASLTSYTMVCMVIGYAIGTFAIPKYLSQSKALFFSALAGLIFSLGAMLSSETSSSFASILFYGHFATTMSSQTAYFVCLPCYGMMLFYAVKGHKIRRWK